MCGIFAIFPHASMKKFNAKRLFMGLSLLNDSRGGHSHGVFGAAIKPIRGIGNLAGSRCMDTVLDTWGETFRPGDWIAGHTRYATHGAVSKKNAHPFTSGGITLAHNGVVDVDGYEKAHDVDSARIAIAMADLDPVRAISLTRGSIGLVFSEDWKLRIYRSGQSLHWAHGEWGWAVSSSGDHLDHALGFAKLHGKVDSVPESKILAPWYGEGAIPAKAAPELFSGLSYDWNAYRTRSLDATPYYTRSGAATPSSGWAGQRPGWEDTMDRTWDEGDPCDSCRRFGDHDYYEEVDAILCEDCHDFFIEEQKAEAAELIDFPETA